MTNYDAGLGGGAILRLSVVQASQNVSANQSTDNWSLTLIKGSFSSWSATPIPWSVTINGTTYSGSYTFDFTVTSSQLLGSGSTTVTHNSDGTKSTSVSGYTGDTGTSTGGPATASGTFTQTTIPRASTPTLSPNPIDAGATLTITTNRASSSFTHTIEYSFGSASGTIATGVGVSTTWVPPLSLLTQIPNATSGLVTITTKTYNGATLIGTTTKTFTLTVPSSVVPDFGTITVSENVTAVSTNVGAYVQGLSKLNLAITSAVGAYGSTITSYKIEVDGQAINAVSGTTGLISSSGTVAIVGTVTDSRGRTHQETVNVTVLAYVGPTIDATIFQSRRALVSGVIDENGTYIRVDLKASTQSLLVSAVQKNNLTYKIYTRLRGATLWTLAKTVTPAGISFNSYDLVSPYSITSSWEVLVTVQDKFQTAQIAGTVSTSAIFMHWSDTGLGVGKFWEQGGLDVLGQIYQNNGLAVIDTSDAATTSVPGIVELATSAEAVTGTDTTRAVTPAALAAGVAGSAFARNRNRVHNGNFRTNQRTYVSNTALTSNQYCFDRWQAITAVQRINYVPNPNFETAITGWSATGGSVARVTTQFNSGVASGQCIASAQGNTITTAIIDVGTASLTFTASVYVKGEAGKLVRLTLEEDTAASALVGQTSSADITMTGSWQRISVSRTFGATGTKFKILVANRTVGAHTFYIDDALVEVAAAVGTYFDGSTTDTSDIDYQWSGTVGASSSYAVTKTYLLFTSAPQGQAVTINPTGVLRQTVERADVAAGPFVLSWTGTATGRIYNSGAAAPSYAVSPVLFTADGLADVVIEFTNGTLSQVQLESGSAPSPYEVVSITDELQLCQRFYYRITAASGSVNPWGQGPATSATAVTVVQSHPVRMRVAPTLDWSGVLTQYAIRSGATLNPTSIAASGSTSTDFGVIDVGYTTGGLSGPYLFRSFGGANTPYIGWSADF